MHNSETVSELCIKSEEVIRLWMELKRIDREAGTTMKNDYIGADSYIKGFSIDKKDIYISNDDIKVILNGSVKYYSRDKFKKSPKRLVKLIRDSF